MIIVSINVTISETIIPHRADLLMALFSLLDVDVKYYF